MTAPTPHTTLPRAADALKETLIAFFLEGVHAVRPRRLGLEFECLRVRASDCSAAPSRGPDGPDPLILQLGEHYRDHEEMEVIRECGDISVLRLGSLNFSLEPGGQLEVSFPPLDTPRRVELELKRFRLLLESLLDDTPYRAVYLGHQPRSMPDEIELRSKPRYQIMNRRLGSSGRLGRHMMRATAGMQVTLDYRSEEECVSMLRAALVAAPFVTAMFANSPLVGGRNTGYASYREKVWWDTDSSRCGVPVKLLSADARLEDYVDFALDAEMWFVRRNDVLREVRGRKSFRAALAAGNHLTQDDFALHSTTLFPSARLRGGVEVRSADCVPEPLAPAFCAMHAGLLYDDDVRARAAELHPYRDLQAVRQLHESVARHGVSGVLADGTEVRHKCQELLDLAATGLQRMVKAGVYEAGTEHMLAPAEAIVAAGESPAVDVVRRFEKEKGLR